MDLKVLQALLTRWASINSGSDNIKGLAAMCKALSKAFSKIKGAKLELIELGGTKAKALSVRVRPKAHRQILLSGHYDTVYNAKNPFQNVTMKQDNQLNGPGVADMKGGIVVMLAALLELEKDANAQQLGYEVLLTPDEETGSVASRTLIEARAASKQFEFALIFEPARANGDLVKSRKGIGLFKLTVHGKAAHAGGNLTEGRNAILALCECLPRLNQLAEDMPSILVNVGSIVGGGAVNVVPDIASALVNIRITHKADEISVRKKLNDISEYINTKEGFRLSIEGGFNRPPKESTLQEELLFKHWQAYALECGEHIDWQHVAGGSDGNFMTAVGLPNLDGLGPVGDHLHSENEYIILSSLVTRSRIAALFLKGIASGKVARV